MAVTAGYITEQARGEFYGGLDAVNVDLKGFTEGFYEKLCFAELGPVLDTLRWIKQETDVWLEVTTLLIPGKNDSEQEVARLSEWCAENLGPETPLHFSAFHPDFKMTDIEATPPATLARARAQALEAGLRHVYTGNVHDAKGQSTYCGGCGATLIERDWYRLGAWKLDDGGCCLDCGTRLAGHFDAEPGNWGAQRKRLRISA